MDEMAFLKSVKFTEKCTKLKEKIVNFSEIKCKIKKNNFFDVVLIQFCMKNIEMSK